MSHVLSDYSLTATPDINLRKTQELSLLPESFLSKIVEPVNRYKSSLLNNILNKSQINSEKEEEKQGFHGDIDRSNVRSERLSDIIKRVERGEIRKDDTVNSASPENPHLSNTDSSIVDDNIKTRKFISAFLDTNTNSLLKKLKQNMKDSPEEKNPNKSNLSPEQVSPFHNTGSKAKKSLSPILNNFQNRSPFGSDNPKTSIESFDLRSKSILQLMLRNSNAHKFSDAFEKFVIHYQRCILSESFKLMENIFYVNLIITSHNLRKK